MHTHAHTYMLRLHTHAQTFKHTHKLSLPQLLYTQILAYVAHNIFILLSSFPCSLDKQSARNLLCMHETRDLTYSLKIFILLLLLLSMFVVVTLHVAVLIYACFCLNIALTQTKMVCLCLTQHYPTQTKRT